MTTMLSLLIGSAVANLCVMIHSLCVQNELRQLKKRVHHRFTLIENWMQTFDDRT